MKPDGESALSAIKRNFFIPVWGNTRTNCGQDGYAITALKDFKRKTGGTTMCEQKILYEKNSDHNVCANCTLIPVKPKYVNEYHCYCGKCDKRIPLKHKPQFCMRCGQKVDWT